MKIASWSNTQQNRAPKNFKAIQFINYNKEFSSIKSKLKTELENFIRNPNNASELGAGKFGETYKFNNPALSNIVVKQSKKEYKDNYAQEYNNLIQAPTNKVGGQAGVARAYDHSTKKYYLLSTLTEGKEVSEYNRYTENHLKSLFSKMFELDKEGFYHGDLNGKNILLTKNGTINFIDYQWAQKISNVHLFDSDKSQKLLLPLSHFPENAQMFEMATMPYYIERIGSQKEKEDFMRMYLKTKAEYHQKRYDYVKTLYPNWPYYNERELIKDSMKAENAKAKIYKNPTDDILRIELKKLQFLADYRDAYGHVDPNILDRNIIASPSSYLCSISAVQDYRKEIAKVNRTCWDSDLREYLKAQEEYGKYWYENLVSFTSDTFDYVMRAVTKNLDSHETKHKFYIDERNPRVIKQNRDVLEALADKFHTTYDRNFSTVNGIEDTMHNIFSAPMQSIKKAIKSDEKAYHRCKKVQHAYGELKNFNREGKVLDLLNTAELMTLKVREFLGYAKHNMSSYSLGYTLSNMHESSANLTERIFNTIIRNLDANNPSSIVVQGYKNMRKFVTKI